MARLSCFDSNRLIAQSSCRFAAFNLLINGCSLVPVIASRQRSGASNVNPEAGSLKPAAHKPRSSKKRLCLAVLDVVGAKIGIIGAGKLYAVVTPQNAFVNASPVAALTDSQLVDLYRESQAALSMGVTSWSIGVGRSGARLVP
jgi:hypothetical protein